MSQIFLKQNTDYLDSFQIYTVRLKKCISVEIASTNLDYEWSVQRDEDCWFLCGEKGGSCSACQLNSHLTSWHSSAKSLLNAFFGDDGDDGYCCSQTKLTSNGDCPTEAVNAMISSSDTVVEMHQCVRKISLGK